MRITYGIYPIEKFTVKLSTAFFSKIFLKGGRKDVSINLLKDLDHNKIFRIRNTLKEKHFLRNAEMKIKELPMENF